MDVNKLRSWATPLTLGTFLCSNEITDNEQITAG